MVAGMSLDWVWDERFWFPSNRSMGWKDLVNKPGSSTYLPQISHLHWALLMGITLLGVRYLLEKLVVEPVGLWLGISPKKKRPATPNSQLEAVYQSRQRLNKDTLKSLSKQTDLTERQLEVWFRRRKCQDAPTQMKKFKECCWHLIFYSTVFIYGTFILVKKDYFWKTILCWENWPQQHVGDDVYWYYMIELAFYWSLVFTLFSDHKRKDFKEMIIHHIATMVLMYFSWILNFVRVGTLVLLVHDAADSWLAMAKIFIYTKNKLATDVFFGIFLIIWVITRIVIYPYCLLYCTTVEPYLCGLIDVTFGAHQFFNFFLYLLQVLHLIWTYLIFRIVYRKIAKGNVEDVRSDSEEDDVESDDEDEDKDEKTIEDSNPITVTQNGIIQNGFLKGNGVHQDKISMVNGTNEAGNGIMNGNNNTINGKAPASPSRIPRSRPRKD